jgi:hypothetical protein
MATVLMTEPALAAMAGPLMDLLPGVDVVVAD